MNSSVWAAQGNKEKKWIWVFLSNFWGCFFSTFCGQKKLFFLNSLSSPLKSCIKNLFVKIGCHSCFNPEWNTERSFIDSLYNSTGIMGGKVCLRYKSKKLLVVVNKLLKTKSLLPSTINVFALLPQVIFPAHSFFNEGGGW